MKFPITFLDIHLEFKLEVCIRWGIQGLTTWDLGYLWTRDGQKRR